MAKSKSKSTEPANKKKQEKYPCTHNDVLQHVMTLKGSGDKECHIWAGGAYDVREAIEVEYPKLKQTVSLGGSSTRNLAKPSPRKWSSVRAEGPDNGLLKDLPTAPKHPEVPAIVIDWPDMGVPGYPIEWWEQFVDNLWEFDGDIAFHCHGGHGRTGTALAIIAHLSGICQDEDPVDWVRENYCRHTVESKKQIDYLNEIGVKTKAEPCKGSGKSWSPSGNWQSQSGFLDGDDAGTPFIPATVPKNEEGDCCTLCFTEDGVSFVQEQMCYLCTECEHWSVQWGSGHG